MKGIFISFEGGDGSGKTTQINLLEQYFIEKGKKVLITREPGGTNISEKVRQVILDINNKEMNANTELLLYAAARAQLVAEVIIPALEAGKIVISDRFVDSSIVYQGYARHLGKDKVMEINKVATQGINPDVTFYLDLDASVGISRKKKQTELDRMEAEKLAFHKQVVGAYRELAKENADRIVQIDAALSVEEIHKVIVERVSRLDIARR